MEPLFILLLIIVITILFRRIGQLESKLEELEDRFERYTYETRQQSKGDLRSPLDMRQQHTEKPPTKAASQPPASQTPAAAGSREPSTPSPKPGRTIQFTRPNTMIKADTPETKVAPEAAQPKPEVNAIKETPKVPEPTPPKPETKPLQTDNTAHRINAPHINDKAETVKESKPVAETTPQPVEKSVEKSEEKAAPVKLAATETVAKKINAPHISDDKKIVKELEAAPQNAEMKPIPVVAKEKPTVVEERVRKVDAPYIGQDKTEAVKEIKEPVTEKVAAPAAIAVKVPESVEESRPGIVGVLFSKLFELIRRYFTEGNILVRIGGIVLFIGLAFLVKYAAENSMISMEFRLISIALFALALLYTGWRLREREGHYGTILQGLGVAIFYLVVYAAAKLYVMLPLKAAFFLMLMIVIVGSLLAVMQNALPLALFAISGGFLAPILTSEGGGSHVILFSYYALLDAGIVGIAWYRSWRVLNFTGFTFTFVIATWWGVLKYEPALLLSTEPFLILFFLFYLAISILFTLKQPFKPRAFIDATLVFELPVVAFALQVSLVGEIENAVLYSALGVGTIYLVLSKILFGYRQMELLAEAFLALGVVFYTIAVPYALDDHLTSALWVLEAAAVIWVSLRQERGYARVFGYFFQTLAVGLFIASTIFRYSPNAFVNVIFMEYALVIAATLFTSYMLYAYSRSHHYSFSGRTASRFFLVVGLGVWLLAGVFEAQKFSEPFGNVMLLYVTLGTVLFALIASRLRWEEMTDHLQYYLFAGVILFAILGERYFASHPFEGAGFTAVTLFFFIHFKLLSTVGREWKLQPILHPLGLWLLVGIMMREMHYKMTLASDIAALQMLGMAALPLLLSWWFTSRSFSLMRCEESYRGIGTSGLLTMLFIASIPYAFADALSAALFVLETTAIAGILARQGRVQRVTFVYFLQMITIALFLGISVTMTAERAFVNPTFLGYIIVIAAVLLSSYRLGYGAGERHHRASLFFLVLAFAVWMFGGLLEAHRLAYPPGNVMLVYIAFGAVIFSAIARRYGWSELVAALQYYLFAGLLASLTLVEHAITSHPFGELGMLGVVSFFAVHYALLVRFESKWSIQSILHPLGLWTLVAVLMREIGYQAGLVSDAPVWQAVAVAALPIALALRMSLRVRFLPAVFERYHENYRTIGVNGLFVMLTAMTLSYALHDYLSSVLLIIESSLIIWVSLRLGNTKNLILAELLQAFSILLLLYSALQQSVAVPFLNEVFAGFTIAVAALLFSAYRIHLYSRADQPFQKKASWLFMAAALLVWLFAGILEAGRVAEPFGNVMLLYIAAGAALYATLALRLRWRMLMRALELYLFAGMIFFVNLVGHYTVSHPFEGLGMAAVVSFFAVHFMLLARMDRAWKIQSSLHPLGLWLLVAVMMREIAYQVGIVTDALVWHTLSVAALPLSLALWMSFRESFLPLRFERYHESYRNLGVNGLWMLLVAATLFYAFDDYLSSVLLIVETAIIIWVALKRGKANTLSLSEFAQKFAIVLLVISSLRQSAERPFINEVFFGLAVAIAALLFSAYRIGRDTGSGQQQKNSWITLGAALALWLFAGILEAGRVTGSLAHVMLLYIAAGAALYTVLSLKLQWREMMRALEFYFFVGLFFLMTLAGRGIAPHPFDVLETVAAGSFFVMHFVLLAHVSEEWKLRSWLHPLGLWIIVGFLTSKLYFQVSLLSDDLAIHSVSLVLIPMVVSWWIMVHRHFLPLSLRAYEENYRSVGVGGMMAFVMLWELYSFTLVGESFSIRSVEIFNPLNIVDILVLVIFSYWFYINKDRFEHRVRMGAFVSIALLSMLLISVILARFVHHFAAVPYTLSGLFGNMLFQMGLSILWSILAIVAMLFAKSLSHRLLWIAGFSVLLLVVLKLFVIELAGSGTIERIVSFIAVGGLMLIIGYYAPLPPRREVTESAEENSVVMEAEGEEEKQR